MPGEIQRLREDVAAGVTRQPRTLGGRRRDAPLGAVHGVVAAPVVVGGSLARGRLAGTRRAVERAALAVEGQVHLPDHLRVGDRLRGPEPGVRVVRMPTVRQEVHGQHAELQRGATRNEESRPVLARAGHPHERRVALGEQRVEHRTTMAVLQDPDAAATQVHQVALQLLEHLERHGRRARAEVEHASTGKRSHRRMLLETLQRAHARLTIVKRPALSTAGFLRIAASWSSLGAWSRWMRAIAASPPS